MATGEPSKGCPHLGTRRGGNLRCGPRHPAWSFVGADHGAAHRPVRCWHSVLHPCRGHRVAQKETFAGGLPPSSTFRGVGGRRTSCSRTAGFCEWPDAARQDACRRRSVVDAPRHRSSRAGSATASRIRSLQAVDPHEFPRRRPRRPGMVLTKCTFLLTASCLLALAACTSGASSGGLCANTTLEAEPSSAAPGAIFLVTGANFRGCHDTGQGQPEPDQDVRLEFRQGSRRWPLGSVAANSGLVFREDAGGTRRRRFWASDRGCLWLLRHHRGGLRSCRVKAAAV